MDIAWANTNHFIRELKNAVISSVVKRCYYGKRVTHILWKEAIIWLTLLAVLAALSVSLPPS